MQFIREFICHHFGLYRHMWNLVTISILIKSLVWSFLVGILSMNYNCFGGRYIHHVCTKNPMFFVIVASSKEKIGGFS